MLDELKNAYKLVQYGLKIKAQLGFAVLFVYLAVFSLISFVFSLTFIASAR